VPIITLLSDFGCADTYVGQMKGAVLSVCPTATLVDLTHEVPAQDVRRGAFLLWSAVLAFPPGTFHLAIVDPGVGSVRRAIALRTARGDVLIGPDNGILVPAADRLGGMTFAVELSNPEFWRERLSRTFHGRDLFGPVAGHLARGAELRAMGAPISNLSAPVRFPVPVADAHRIAGEIVHVDGFGTLVTNIPEEMLPPYFVVQLDSHRVRGAREAVYESVPSGSLIALIGSSALLEIAARGGSAASVLGISVGHPLHVQPAATQQGD